MFFLTTYSSNNAQKGPGSSRWGAGVCAPCPSLSFFFLERGSGELCRPHFKVFFFCIFAFLPISNFSALFPHNRPICFFLPKIDRMRFYPLSKIVHQIRDNRGSQDFSKYYFTEGFGSFPNFVFHSWLRFIPRTK